MDTYYSDESVRVTSAAFEVDARSYPLRELAQVWHRRGARGTGQLRRTLLTRGALGLLPLLPLALGAVVATAALSVSLSSVNRVALLVAAGLVAMVSWPLLDIALSGVDRTYDRGTRVHEIWARWHGHDVLLLRTGNALRFGRVYRALQRALDS